mmetsp:Transcript_5656/g.14338  ORF Transcript_5656/g.14338 Transcript_5656/m.14338 type:complete len:132 (+) Transcript_5656:482-877(+)
MARVPPAQNVKKAQDALAGKDQENAGIAAEKARVEDELARSKDKASALARGKEQLKEKLLKLTAAFAIKDVVAKAERDKRREVEAKARDLEAKALRSAKRARDFKEEKAVCKRQIKTRRWRSRTRTCSCSI